MDLDSIARIPSRSSSIGTLHWERGEMETGVCEFVLVRNPLSQTELVVTWHILQLHPLRACGVRGVEACNVHTAVLAFGHESIGIDATNALSSAHNVSLLVREPIHTCSRAGSSSTTPLVSWGIRNHKNRNFPHATHDMK